MEVDGKLQVADPSPSATKTDTHWTGGWVGNRGSLKGFGDEKISCSWPISKPEPSSPCLIAVPTSIPAVYTNVRNNVFLHKLNVRNHKFILCSPPIWLQSLVFYPKGHSNLNQAVTLLTSVFWGWAWQRPRYDSCKKFLHNMEFLFNFR